MTDQAPPLEAIQPSHVPQRIFFQRCSPLGVYVLPARCLDNTPLKDETGKPILNLRQQCSSQGLCFAHVLRPTTAGDQYWADVAATPDMENAERALLTEEQLAFALPWDERLYRLSRAQIRRLMFTQARNLKPLRPHAARPAETLLPAPTAPMRMQTPVAVNSEDLRDALSPASGRPKKHRTSSPPRWSNTLDVQQWLLRAMLRAIQKQVAYAQNEAIAQAIQARCLLLEDILEWQHQTHQRVVHVDQSPTSQHRSVWLLTLEMPETVFAPAGATAAAA